MTTKLTVGFIGPGLMGHSMAKHLLNAGYPLGSALKLKLINSLLSLGHAVLTAEAVAAARATGRLVAW